MAPKGPPHLAGEFEGGEKKTCCLLGSLMTAGGPESDANTWIEENSKS